MSTSVPNVNEAIQRLLRRRSEQGLPPSIEDEGFIGQVAAQVRLKEGPARRRKAA